MTFLKCFSPDVNVEKLQSCESRRLQRFSFLCVKGKAKSGKEWKMMKETHPALRLSAELAVPISHCCCFLTWACEKRHTDIEELKHSRQASLSKTNKTRDSTLIEKASESHMPSTLRTRPGDTESLQFPRFQHLDGIITITWLETPICSISTSLYPTAGSCANPSLADKQRLSHYNPLTVESDIGLTQQNLPQVGSVHFAFPIKFY